MWGQRLTGTVIGNYIMDTLQIFFAWDDDLYTHLKERGLGQKGIKSAVLPLVYTDNSESTTGVNERAAKCVIPPERFGETYENLGWKQTAHKNEPIIKSERPQVQVSLEDDKRNLKFRIVPSLNKKEQYHLEYSSMSAFGSMYNNWAIVVLRTQDFQDILQGLGRQFPEASSIVDVPIHKESKQGQRENFYFVKVPVKSYKFSIGEFLYAKKYFELNGIFGTLPSLVYENEPSYNETMEPVLKVGFVHTKKEEGFQTRPPQCAIKLAQHKVSLSKRGEKSKMKGRIVCVEPYENFFTVPAKEFYVSSAAIRNADPVFLDRTTHSGRIFAKKRSDT